MALEPFVRRRWPERIISWNRLLAGDFRDPLVGRDILIGASFGSALALVLFVWTLAPKWLGWPPDVPYLPHPLDNLLGVRGVVNALTDHLFSTVMQALVELFVFLLLSIVLRKVWAAILVGWLLMAFALMLGGNYPAIDWLFAGFSAGIVVFVLARYGLLAVIFTQFFLFIFLIYPMTTDFSAWYAGNTIFALFLGIALTLYGFFISLAGQPLLRGGLLRDE
jgi:serine/threonine-protein kinase